MQNDEVDFAAEPPEGAGLTTLDACPGCGNYYVLTEGAPSMPWHLAEHGTDEEQDDWEQSHNYNVITCTVCDFNSEDD